MVVSHDREFLDGLTNRIWDIENKTLVIHHFGVKEYLARKMSNDSIYSAEAQDKKENKSSSEKIAIEEQGADKPDVSYEEQKRLKQLKNKLNNQVSKSEEQIEVLEKKIAILDNDVAKIDYSDEVQANKILADYEKTKSELDEQMKIWEEATEELMGL